MPFLCRSQQSSCLNDEDLLVFKEDKSEQVLFVDSNERIKNAIQVC